MEEVFYSEMMNDPSASSAWGVMADWLEERGDHRAELLRLTLALLRPCEGRLEMERRVQCLLADGVIPCWPTVTNSLGMRLALIPSGTFLMGSPDGEEGRYRNETPRHEVTLTRPFLLGVYAVTQEQYVRVMGTNPSYFARPGNYPVEYVPWVEAADFCRLLSEREKAPYRLPTEAEWEFACRGATTSPFHFGTSLSSAQANFDGERPYGSALTGQRLLRPAAVGSYPPNAFGLYDMHGNVDEWCGDWYGAYPAERQIDPTGPATGQFRVLRGGGWARAAKDCRSAFRSARRGRCRAKDRYANLGFRVAMDVSLGETSAGLSLSAPNTRTQR